MSAYPTLARIVRPELADFGKQLLAAGFKVYVFKSDTERVAKGDMESVGTHIRFSREVDGRTCFGSVSYGLSGHQFNMPIKPSREHGSGMFISHRDQAPEFDELTIENAELYASPTGYNPLVGTHENYDKGYDHLYVEVAG